MTSTHAWILVSIGGLSLLTTILYYVIIISRRIVTSDQIDKLATKELLKSTRELLEKKLIVQRKGYQIKSTHSSQVYPRLKDTLCTPHHVRTFTDVIKTIIT